MMRVRLASEPAPGHAENEDHAFHAGPLVAVFDGVTVLPGTDTGCVHGPAWYVRRLTARLTEVAAERPTDPLTDQVAEAIARVRDDHEGRCDLDNPETPAATVCLVRDGGETLDYLILSDSSLVVELGGEVRVVTDRRFRQAVAALRQMAATGDYDIGRSEQGARVRRTTSRKHELINRPGGYWVAAADPEAGQQAVTGSLPLVGRDRVRRAALLTDGASCAVDDYALMNWAELLDLLTRHGPEELIRRVRVAENGDPDRRAFPRYKRHDDASAALCVFEK